MVATDSLETRLQQLETAGHREQERSVVEQRNAEESVTSWRFITRMILWTFTGSLIAYAAAAVAGLPAAPALLEVIKIAVLPLTTLVLGYYLSCSG